MSKGGGAGKVYFVLYLAVILELLIIIVERDEAEEGLMQKQKESMKIVESILSQLQSGAGSEGINTRPQDEITIIEGMSNPEIVKNFKDFRRYSVEVGVTDIGASMFEKKEGENEEEWHKRLQTYVRLGNVSDLDYQVFYSSNSDPNNAPPFPTTDDFKKKIDVNKLTSGQQLPNTEPGSNWEFLTLRRLELDNEATYSNLLNDVKNSKDGFVMQPKYKNGASIGSSFAPNGVTEDSVFAYSSEKTGELARLASGGLGKRSFFVQFKPPSRPGWYKLRFASRTSRILGVRADEKAAELKEETTVNIGTVQLKVKDLLKVKKELGSKLAGKFGLPEMEALGQSLDIFQFDESLKKALDLAGKDEKASELTSQINLYGYIAKLLAPGQSANLDQNCGSIEFNIHVVKPDIPVAKPTVTLNPEKSYTCFDKLTASFDFAISPFKQNANKVSGYITDASGSKVGTLVCSPIDENASVVKAADREGANRYFRATSDKELAPGKYKIRIEHSLDGKTEGDEAELDVFPSKLIPDNEKEITQKLQITGFYGNTLNLNIQPSSGSKIKSNQFRTYLFTDKESQKEPVVGFNSSIFLPADAKTVNLRVTWVQPGTNKEIDLYPMKPVEIQQGKPKIILPNTTPSYSGNAKRVRVVVKGLVIKGSFLGDPNNLGAEAKTSVSIGKPTVAVPGFDIVGAPVYNESEKSVTFELQGSMPRNESQISGTVKVPVIATATNTINGKSSDAKQDNLVVRVDFTPEQDRKPQRKSR